jgi:hypothetical protein
MTAGGRAAALALGAALAVGGLPSGAAAQEVRTAILGDSLRVGDVVPVAVRVVVDRGARVAWPDTLPLPGEEVENAARVRERVDTLEDGRLAITGIYSVTPWRTGELPLPEVPFQVEGTGEAVRTLTAALPALEVVSVLPEDTAGIEPRPAKGVLGASWALWPFLLALLLLALLLAALLWWLRRRRAASPAIPEAPPVSPRDRALATLDAAREAGLVEAGEMKEFYTRTADAVREYVAALAPGWGEDLTTTELLSRFRAQVDPRTSRALGVVLRPADQVKFARRTPDADTAIEEWDRARQWVSAFQWPPRPVVDQEEAA